MSTSTPVHPEQGSGSGRHISSQHPPSATSSEQELLETAVLERVEELARTNPAVYRAVRKSIEFVEGRLAEPITIPEMSRAAATSVSKLERIFRDEFGMPPSRYILMRRLARAHRTLARSRGSSISVAAVALDCGFSHLGRFAGAYRRQFGELPSETLSLTRSLAGRRPTLANSG